MTRRAQMGGGFPRHGPRRPLDGSQAVGLEDGLRALALVVEESDASTLTLLESQQPVSGAEARRCGCAANDSPRPGPATCAAASRDAVGRALPMGLPAPGLPAGDGAQRPARPNQREAIRPRGADVSLPLRVGLTSGRWTLVETYERDGEVYILARKSASRVQSRRMSTREHQAVGLATTGVSNKEIAFEMGISASTVGVLLHRAARKLGCRNRGELFARFSQIDSTTTDATLAGPTPGGPSEASAAAP